MKTHLAHRKGEKEMYRSAKIRLKPTPEQEVLFRKSAGVARWAYNFYLAENERVYREYLENGKIGDQSISAFSLCKHINNELKPTTHSWLKEVSNNVMKRAVKDAETAMKRGLRGISSRPVYKSKRTSKPSFYVNYESLRSTANGFQGERLGTVKTAEDLPRIPSGVKYSNPRVTFDGFYWYLSVSYEVEVNKVRLDDLVLGVDVGIKDLAIVSNGKVYKNINKTKRVRKLEKRLRREQRKMSRKQIANTKSYDKNRKPTFKRPLHECKNWNKQVAVVRGLYKQLTDIRQNHLHQASAEIVKTKPSHIVMETLNISGMMKNKHLSKALSNQKLYEFKRQVQYKCETYGIEFVEADRWFPSSKLCSSCGCKKVTLKLADRTYHCNECGLTIDRDYNASLNLANYQI